MTGETMHTQFFTCLLLIAASALAPAIQMQQPPSTATARPRAAPFATSTGAKLPSGLVYLSKEGVWLVDRAGKPWLWINGSNFSGVKLSPDRTKALYALPDNDDIWLMDLKSGETRNITKTPGKFETTFQWIGLDSKRVLFTVIPSQEQLGPWLGYVGIVNADGTGYRILDGEQGLGDVPAPSPDGKSIAYSSGQPFIYHLDTDKRESFSLTPFDVTAKSASGPAWSPHGDKLAWTVGGVIGTQHHWKGTGIFDLTSKSGSLLHPFFSHIGTEYTQVNIWSPNSTRIAVLNFGEIPSRVPVLWVLDFRTGNEFRLGRAEDKIVWSPDSNQIAFLSVETNHWMQAGFDETSPSPTLGKPTPLIVPEGATVIDWILLQ